MRIEVMQKNLEFIKTDKNKLQRKLYRASLKGKATKKAYIEIPENRKRRDYKRKIRYLNKRKNQMLLVEGKTCLCGCNQEPNCKNGYVKGHYNKGDTRTEEEKQYLSEINRGKNNPHYGKLAAKGGGFGIRCDYGSPFQKTISFHSSYELAYAKYLDSIEEPWFYELETFELTGDMTYTPDFFLPRLEKFIEIKGWFNEKAKTKFEKFKEEYPFDIEILFKQDLKNLGVI
jgi:hypothetical protein